MKKQKTSLIKWLLVVCVVLTAAGLLIFQTSRYAALVESNSQNAVLSGHPQKNALIAFFYGIFGFGPNSFWGQMFHGNNASSTGNAVQQANNGRAGNNAGGTANSAGNTPNAATNAGTNAGNNLGNGAGNTGIPNPGEGTENNSGTNSGNNPSDNSVNNNPTGDNGNPTDNGNPGDYNNPGDNGSGNPGDNSGGNPGDNSGGNPGSSSGNPVGNPVSSSGGNPGGGNPSGNANNPGGAIVQYCVPGCYPGCIPGCDPLCTPPTCLLGNASPVSLPTANPIPATDSVSQIIAQQDQEISLLVQLLNEYQTITNQVMEAAQAGKYQTVNSQDIASPDDTPAPSDIVTKIQSGQLIQH
ncbi:MAG: hypothetical protein KGK03_02925 [Candidatus Omnitrophica bacterium]|nr:hypothetical protein [Candidatus Omnitrophota bacterium]MDE2222005.1 hypothetical protein [Candidatus Omnitrophota bacterium]